MGSCVSKKAARARGKVAAPLPVVEKETAHALPPVAEVAEEEEVKEVVLSETPAPRPPRPPPELVKRRTEQPEAEEESASEACSASDSASVESAAKEKARAKAKLQKAGGEPELEKRAMVDAPEKGRTTLAEERESKAKGRGGTNGRARSPSPSSAHRRQQPAGFGHQQHHPPAPRPRRDQHHPPVVSGIGCRSGRFSPSAARRAAESAVRRTHSAREADMALPSKRSLSAAISGSALSRRDPGERSGRRSDSPTGRRAPASPSATHRAASPARKAGKDHGTPERARPRARDGDEPPTLAGLGGGERKKVAGGKEGTLGQTPRWPWTASSSCRD